MAEVLLPREEYPAGRQTRTIALPARAYREIHVELDAAGWPERDGLVRVEIEREVQLARWQSLGAAGTRGGDLRTEDGRTHTHFTTTSTFPPAHGALRVVLTPVQVLSTQVRVRGTE